MDECESSFLLIQTVNLPISLTELLLNFFYICVSVSWFPISFIGLYFLLLLKFQNSPVYLAFPTLVRGT